MEIGLFAPVATLNAGPAFLRALGPAVERGFESIWVPEHVVMFDDYDSPYPYSPDGRFPGGSDTGLLEPLTALTYLAAVTDRVRLGTAICLIRSATPSTPPSRSPTSTCSAAAGSTSASASAGCARSTRCSTCRSSAVASEPTSTSH